MTALKRLFGVAIFCVFASFTFAAAQETQTVEATGFADSEKQAELAALDRAVRMVIGELVDSETRVESEALIEKILISSRGQVESHEVLSSEKDEDGVWTVKIRATIKKSDLNARLKTKGIATKKFDGTTVGANIDLVKGQDNQNILYLANFLKSNEFPYSILDVEIEEEPKVVKQDGDDVIVEVGYIARPNMERYNAFVNELTKILDKVAIRKSSFVFQMMREKEEKVPDKNKLAICQAMLFLPDENKRKRGPTPEQGNITISVCVRGTANNKMTQWQSYELSGKFGILFEKYLMLIPAFECAVNDASGNGVIAQRKPLGIMTGREFKTINLFPQSGIYVFFPTEEQRESVTSFIINTDKYGNTSWNESSWQADKKRVLVAPFGCCYYGNRWWYSYFRNSVQFTLSSDDLRNVKSASIALVPENPDMDKFYEGLEKELKLADE